MVAIANLGKLDTAQLARARGEIDKLATSLNRLGKSSGAAEKSSEKASRSIKHQGRAFSDLGSKLTSLSEGQVPVKSLPILSARAEPRTSTIQHESEGGWGKGIKDAKDKYVAEALDVAGKTEAVFTAGFKSMEQGLNQFAVTGKFKFSDFARSVLTDMASIATQAAASGLLGSLINAGASAFGAPQGAGGAQGASSRAAAFGGARAIGGAVGPNRFYRVNEMGPELFSQQGRTYLMSGASGGTVVPLSGTGTSASSRPTGGVNVSIAIASDGKTDVSADGAGLEAFGQHIGEIAAQKYRELEARSLSSQGNIRRAINGR
jgi:hypothetical protein